VQKDIKSGIARRLPKRIGNITQQLKINTI
jgi:hypothetical protein